MLKDFLSTIKVAKIRENKIKKERKQIDMVVKKVVDEYGETLRLLGKS